MKKITALLLTVVFLISPLAAASFADYENTHENTGDLAADIVAVAITQLGYKEGSLDGTVQGDNDCTKYGLWYGLNYQPWCAMFVSWCANQAAVPVSIIPRHASCDSGMNWFKSHGRWQYAPYYGGTYTPKPADIIYFGYKYGQEYDATHVGIVYYVEEGKVCVLEGNSSAKVQTVKYNLDTSYILGYGVPDYTSSAASGDPYPLGIWKVTASALNVRDDPDVDGTHVIGIRYEGDLVEILEVQNEFWGKILLEDGSFGWISLRYCEVVEAAQKPDPRPDPDPPATEYTVSFELNGGSVGPSPVTVEEGGTAKIPSDIPERDGYAFLGWAAGPAAEKAEYLPGDSFTPAKDVILYAVWTEGETDGLLYMADLNRKAWYMKAVTFCYENALMSGTSKYSFSPSGTLTRAMLVTVIGKVCILSGGEIPAAGEQVFPDVKPGKYYFKYVSWAKSLGIAAGDENGNFIPNGAVTREQLALMLMRAADALGMQTAEGDAALLDAFADRESCSGWAVKGISWACANGILAGSNGNIKPRDPATRAEAAQMIYRFAGLIPSGDD